MTRGYHLLLHLLARMDGRSENEQLEHILREYAEDRFRCPWDNGWRFEHGLLFEDERLLWRDGLLYRRADGDPIDKPEGLQPVTAEELQRAQDTMDPERWDWSDSETAEEDHRFLAYFRAHCEAGKKALREGRSVLAWISHMGEDDFPEYLVTVAVEVRDADERIPFDYSEEAERMRC